MIDTTNDTIPNHPFYIVINYGYAPAYFHFYDTLEEAEAVVRMIVSAIENDRKMIAITISEYISIENVLKIRVVEKGTAVNDIKWLG